MENSSSTVFRTKVDPQTVAEHNPVSKTPSSLPIVSTDTVEVPFLDYQTQHGHPLAVDYFNLGDKWEDVFSQEVGLIDVYFNGKIHDGTLANNVDTIKSELKKMEKILDIKNEERPVVKIGILTSHIKFLIDTDDLKYNMRKFSNENNRV